MIRSAILYLTVPEATHRTEHEYHVHVWATMTVWVMHPPHAIVQISGTECFQQLIPSFTVSAATSRWNPLCAKQNRRNSCAIMCACKMTCHHLPVGCSIETKACRDRLNSSAAVMRGSERMHVPCWQGETFLAETEAPLRRHPLIYVLPNTSAV